MFLVIYSFYQFLLQLTFVMSNNTLQLREQNIYVVVPKETINFFSFFFISNVPRRELNKSHFWSKYVFSFPNKLQLTFKHNDPSFHIFFIFLLPSYMRLNDIWVRNQIDRLDELSFCCLSHFLVSISSFILNLFQNSLFHRSGSVSFAFVFSFYIIVFVNGRV